MSRSLGPLSRTNQRTGIGSFTTVLFNLILLGHSPWMLLSAFANDPTGGDWPSVRGIHHDGIAKDEKIVDQFPSRGPTLLWLRNLGQGYSSIIVHGDRAYTQYQTLSGQYVLCMNAANGQTLWEHRYDWPYDAASVYPGPRSTPTFADGSIYFTSPNGLLGCLDASDGKLQWEVSLLERFQAPNTEFGYACSPLVVDGKVIVPVGGPGSSLVAFDVKSGEVAWQNGNDAISYAGAMPISFQGKTLILGYLRNALVAHDLQTGKRLWRREISSGYDEHSAWPIYREPYLWITSAFRGGAELLELTGDDIVPIRLRRKDAHMSNEILSSVLYDGALFGFDVRDPQAKTHRTTRGVYRSLDFLTGEELWHVGDEKIRSEPSESERAKVPWIGHASTLIADGKLILYNDVGELIIAKADRSEYRELGRASVFSGDINWTQPTLSHGRLFLRNHEQAACLYVGKDPLPTNLSSISEPKRTADLPKRKVIDWASWLLGVEPEFAFDLPSRAWLIEWYLASLALSLLAILSGFVDPLRFVFRRSPQAHEAGTSFSPSVQFQIWLAMILMGLIGTTLLGHLLHRFIFTWPLAIFVPFHALVWQLSWSRRGRHGASSIDSLRRKTWIGRGWALLFLAGCLAYFFACRRLSLVFEWTFLCGFLAALPFSWLSRQGWTKRPKIFEWSMTLAAFSAMYWFSVAILFGTR